MKRLFYFALFFCTATVGYGMEENKTPHTIFYYAGDGFCITVQKTGTLHGLTVEDENDIISWIAQQSILQEQKTILGHYVHQAIGNQIIDAQMCASPKLLDATHYEWEGYRFRRFKLEKDKSIFEVSEQQCQSIAAWLKERGIKKHEHERQRIEVINHGLFFSLQSKSISLYQMLANTDLRKSALKKSQLIACVAIKNNCCEDITEPGLSSAKLQFKFEKLKN